MCISSIYIDIERPFYKNFVKNDKIGVDKQSKME